MSCLHCALNCSGPLVCGGKVAGLTSWGVGCGEAAGEPWVNTALAVHTEWIHSVIGGKTEW